MSRGKKIAITAGVVLVALLIVGALGNATRNGAPGTSPPPAAVQATRTPTDQASPQQTTAQSTPRPTPVRATPRPTPTATPEPTPNQGAAAYADFLDHLVEQSFVFANHADAIGRHATALDVANLRRTTSRALEDAEAELTWLRQHEPAACYAALFGQWQRVINLYAESFTAIDYGLQAPMTVSDVERGAALMQEGTAELGQLSELMSQTNC